MPKEWSSIDDLKPFSNTVQESSLKTKQENEELRNN